MEAIRLVRREPELDVMSAVGLIWDWFDRNLVQEPAYFGGFKSESHLRRYVRKALFRSALNETRKAGRGLAPLPLTMDIADPQSSDSEDIAVWSIFELLPDNERIVLEKLLLKGETPERLAKELKVSRRTISRRMERACDRLNKLLKEGNFP